MIVQYFLKWAEGAKVSERAAAANALARAFIVSEMTFEERAAAEAALTLLLDDPSPKVRMAMAEALSMSPKAPPQIIAGLSADQADIAGMVLSRSPLVTDGDLIDRIATSDDRVQAIIAARPVVSMPVSAALAEVGEPDPCIELLRNDGAQIAAISYRRIAERLGDDARVRSALLANAHLPADVRHDMLVKVGEALRNSDLVKALMGKARAERITKDACTRASLQLTDMINPAEYPALVEHLRVRGSLTTSYVVRSLAWGRIEFFGAILVSLACQPLPRVQAILSEGRDQAVNALFRKSGLPGASHDVLLAGLKVWRDVAAGKREAGAQEVLWTMYETARKRAEREGRAAANDDFSALLKKLYLDVVRENAKGHALAIANAA